MPPAPEKASGMAVAALILAILGIPCCIPGIVGIVLGIIELGRINRGESPMKGKGLATAAIIVGAVGIGINLIFTIISIATGGFSFEVTT